MISSQSSLSGVFFKINCLPLQTLWFVSLSSSSDPLSCQASENLMSRGHTRDAARMGTY